MLNDMKNLDLSSFRNAIRSLSSILTRYENDNYDIDIRDALIHRFEYTYSLAVKMMTRYINMVLPSEVDMTFNETTRKANRLGILLNNLEKWTVYRQKRDMTSHTYDEQTAIDVVSIVPEFKDEAEFLLKKLEEQND